VPWRRDRACRAGIGAFRRPDASGREFDMTTPDVPTRRRTLAFLAGAAGLALIGRLRPARAQQWLRVTAIPDEAPTELARKFAPLGRYLQQRLGVPVEWDPVTDYAAAVEALVNGKVDLAWFGGFTFVQANARSGGRIIPLVQRAEDQDFRSVFITGAESGIHALADLKGRTFSFGSQSSTSGHLMPRSFLLQAGIDPDRDFRRVSYSGAHDATIAAVAGGKVDAGAVNISVWNKFVAEGKVDPKQVKVFYTTPPFYDYNWSVNASMPPALRDKLRQAFLDLTPEAPEGKQILELQRASRFVPTRAENYQGIEAAAKSAGLL
jgi:phosphonate transport system substrate-binding protein